MVYEYVDRYHLAYIHLHAIWLPSNRAITDVQTRKSLPIRKAGFLAWGTYQHGGVSSTARVSALNFKIPSLPFDRSRNVDVRTAPPYVAAIEVSWNAPMLGAWNAGTVGPGRRLPTTTRRRLTRPIGGSAFASRVPSSVPNPHPVSHFEYHLSLTHENAWTNMKVFSSSRRRR